MTVTRPALRCTCVVSKEEQSFGFVSILLFNDAQVGFDFLGYRTSVNVSVYKKIGFRASLVAQWQRICVETQETQVQSLVQEDPTFCGLTKSLHCNY